MSTRRLRDPVELANAIGVAAADLNCRRFCLHLWRPQRLEVPKPPAILVGPPAPRAVATP